MGNICGCCLSNEQENHEYTPVPNVESTVRPRARSVEKSNPSSFQTILESTSNSLLYLKPKYKENVAPEGIDSLRNRMQTAKVDLSAVESSPIIIRPTATGSASNGQDPSVERQQVVRLLTDPLFSKSSKQLESRAVELSKVLQQADEQYQSYQQENLPLVSFSTTSNDK